MKFVSGLLQILFWTLTRSSYATVAQHDGLVNFLSSAMTNYTTWITENGFDPSLSNPNLINLTSKEGGVGKVKLNCQLSNFHISGHSNKSVESSVVEGNLDKRHFRINRHEEIKYSGNYTAEGNTTDSSGQTSSFYGSGPWHVTFKGPAFSILNFEDFQVNNDGYIDLSVPPGTLDYVFSFTEDKFHFEGLWDEGAGYDNPILWEVLHLFIDYVYARAKEDLPSQKLLTEYLKVMFAQTPVSEIVQWPPASLYENNSKKFKHTEF